MKRKNLVYIMVITVILVTILSGCKKKKPEIDEPVKEPIESTEEVEKEDVDKEKLMKDFDNIVENENSPEKIKSFIDKNIRSLTNIEGDKMISELEKALEDALESTKDNMDNLDKDHELINLAGDELFFPMKKLEDIKDDKLREEIEKILNNNYRLINLEGDYYPIIDYEKLKRYNEYISPELQDYIAIKAWDSEKPVVIDGALYISYDTLGERILKTEDYIEKYSEGQRHEEMLKMYKNKLNIYLSGIDNSPISDYETGKIYEDVLKSYEKMGQTEEGVTGFIVRRYLKSIEENDYIIDKTIENSVISLINESLSLLETTK